MSVQPEPGVEGSERASRRRRSEQWRAFHRRAPRLPTISADELRRRLRNAEPATDDDVPWRFPVAVPLEPDGED